MNTSNLATAIQNLNLARLTRLLFSFYLDKLHIQGQEQEISVTIDGTAIKGYLYEVNRTIDFDVIDLELLQRTVLSSFNSDVVLTVSDDRELLITHMFKAMCSGQSLKALKAVEGLSEEEQNTLNALNRANTFMHDILPIILCEEPVQRTKLSNGDFFNFEQFGLEAHMFATGNKSVITMPNNGGYKVYLKEDYETEFFRLRKAGLLMSRMCAYQEVGDFAGCYAVLIPAKV